ncbi:class GN sortase [Colwellia sp. 20A7]|uniref:class GN sortase n=1 Tax=Colwellia sp. 20A7 TaxID=2689569 RepID=UPI00135CE378|nr:class GN sortase [Colwellia sp. 20A7]
MMPNFTLKRDKIIPSLVALFLIIASTSFAMAGYMVIKAHLAQALLASTWQKQLISVDDDHSETKSKNKMGEVNKPWPWADFYPVAKLTFERFNLSHIVLNNDSGQALAFGPGLNQRADSGVEPGQSNVMVISAHNDTHFSILEELSVNDSVTLTLKTGNSSVFKVNKIAILDLATEQLVLLNKSNYKNESSKEVVDIKELILVTCYPFGSVNNETSLRYVVHLS